MKKKWETIFDEYLNDKSETDFRQKEYRRRWHGNGATNPRGSREKNLHNMKNRVSPEQKAITIENNKYGGREVKWKLYDLTVHISR